MKKEINIANFVTFLRFLILPFIIIYATSPKILISLIVLALLFDILDGFLARKLKLETDFGMVFDHATDKALILIVFIILIINYNLSIFWALLILIKDIVMVIERIYSYTRGGMKKVKRIKVTYLGKSMWIIYIIFFISILFNIYPLLFIILTIIYNFIILYSYSNQFIKN